MATEKQYSLSQLINTYTRLETANDNGLKAIREIMADDQHANLNPVFDAIWDMFSHWKILLTSESPYCRKHSPLDIEQILEKVIKKIERKTTTSLMEIALPTEAGLRFALSPNVRKVLLGRRGSIISRLNEALGGSFPPEAVEDLETVLRTPHDLIRYMHETGSACLFEPGRATKYSSENSSEFKSYEAGGIYLRVLSIKRGATAQEIMRDDPFIFHLKTIANQGKFNSKRSQTDHFYFLVGERNIAIQVPLGSHKGYIKINWPREKKTYEIDFKFANTTTYETSIFRGNVTKRILNVLGYDKNLTEEKDGGYQNIRIKKEFSSLHEALEGFEWIVRYCVASKDLDVLVTSKRRYNTKVKYEFEAAKAFFAGVINLYHYFEYRRLGTHIKYAREYETYLGLQDRVKEPSIWRKLL